MTIRFAQEKDIPGLIHLCKLHAIFEEVVYDEEGKQEKLYNYIFSKTPSLYCLVVELDDQIIGYTTYMKQFSTWDASFYIYMDCLFLTEKSRGYGIGEKLMDRIKKEGKNLDCTLIQWQTPNFNKKAIKFYDRIGAKSNSKKRFFLNV